MSVFNAILTWISDPNRLTAISTLAIAAFTVVLAIVGYLQFRLTREALTTTERAFVFLDGFTTELTTAANIKSAEIAELPERYRSHPHLYISRFAVSPRWRNGGNTPTKNMTIKVDWRGPPGSIPPDYVYRNSSKPFFLAPRATEASDVIEIPPAPILVDWSFHPVGDPPMIFIWGRADYEDVFGRPHFVEWCRQLRFECHDGRNLRADFIQWGDYNRSDEDARV